MLGMDLPMFAALVGCVIWLALVFVVAAVASR